MFRSLDQTRRQPTNSQNQLDPKSRLLLQNNQQQNAPRPQEEADQHRPRKLWANNLARITLYLYNFSLSFSIDKILDRY